MKPISISLSPNIRKEDLKLVWRILFNPFCWKKGKSVKEFEQKFAKYLGVKYAVSFNSGRSALMAILKSLDVRGEVLLQAFTCIAAVNPIIWSGLKPRYVDCSSSDYNMDMRDLRAKIGPLGRVLMVQHTFGLPCNMEEVLGLVREKGLILIEDCAHALGAEYKGQKIGTFGKASFFSFGRDKIISSVYGGMAVTNDKDIAKKLYALQKEWKNPSFCWIFQQLLHPVLMQYIVLPLYNIFNLGKVFLVLSQRLGILSKAVHKKEKKGRRPRYFPKCLPNALASLALLQFGDLEAFNRHRQKVAEFYDKKLTGSEYILPKRFPERKSTFLRYTVLHDNAHEIIYNAWHKENIIIGDWYMSPIIPCDTDLAGIGYEKGMCPNAERLSKKSFNLPTHINITLKDAERICRQVL